MRPPRRRTGGQPQSRGYGALSVPLLDVRREVGEVASPQQEASLDQRPPPRWVNMLVQGA